MIRRLTIAAAVLLASCATPAPSHVEPDLAPLRCTDRDDVLRQLAERWDEQIVFWGLTPGGFMVEILSSPDGSWTALVTSPRGLSCFLASGSGGRQIVPEQLIGPPVKHGKDRPD